MRIYQFPKAANGLPLPMAQRIERECKAEMRVKIDDAIRRVEAATERKRAAREAELVAAGAIIFPRRKR